MGSDDPWRHRVKDVKGCRPALLKGMNAREMLPHISCLTSPSREVVDSRFNQEGSFHANCKLLERLESYGPTGFNELVEALRMTGRDDLANMLQPPTADRGVSPPLPSCPSGNPRYGHPTENNEQVLSNSSPPVSPLVSAAAGDQFQRSPGITINVTNISGSDNVQTGNGGTMTSVNSSQSQPPPEASGYEYEVVSEVDPSEEPGGDIEKTEQVSVVSQRPEPLPVPAAESLQPVAPPVHQEVVVEERPHPLDEEDEQYSDDDDMKPPGDAAKVAFKNPPGKEPPPAMVPQKEECTVGVPHSPESNLGILVRSTVEGGEDDDDDDEEETPALKAWSPTQRCEGDRDAAAAAAAAAVAGDDDDDESHTVFSSEDLPTMIENNNLDREGQRAAGGQTSQNISGSDNEEDGEPDLVPDTEADLGDGILGDGLIPEAGEPGVNPAHVEQPVVNHRPLNGMPQNSFHTLVVGVGIGVIITVAVQRWLQR